jgi:hypothetical protein
MLGGCPVRHGTRLEGLSLLEAAMLSGLLPTVWVRTESHGDQALATAAAPWPPAVTTPPTSPSVSVIIKERGRVLHRQVNWPGSSNVLIYALDALRSCFFLPRAAYMHKKVPLHLSRLPIDCCETTAVNTSC